MDDFMYSSSDDNDELREKDLMPVKAKRHKHCIELILNNH